MAEKKRCPPFCGPECDIRHHKLITRLVNVREDDKKSLEKFQWTLEEEFADSLPQEHPIPDSLKEYRYPVLHWASVLGKISAVTYLVRKGYSPTLQSEDKRETALHRVVLLLNQQFPKQELLQRFKSLTSLLAPALFIQDVNGNTPLHVCALLITQYKIDYDRQLLEILIDKVLEVACQGFQQSNAINVRNRDGKTILHILAAADSNDCENVIMKLLENGADPESMDYERKSAIDIAEEKGNLRLCEILSSHQPRKRKQCRRKQCSGDAGLSTTYTQDRNEQQLKISKVSHEHNFVSSTTHKEENDDCRIVSSKIRKVAGRRLDVRPSLVRDEAPSSSGASSSTTRRQSTSEGMLNQLHENEKCEPSLEQASENVNCEPNLEKVPAEEPSLEQLLKCVNQEGVIRDLIEKRRVNLETECEGSDKRMTEFKGRRSYAEKRCEELEQKINEKLMELKELQDEQEICKKLLDEMGEKIHQENEKRKEIEKNFSYCEAIVKRLSKN